MKSKEKDISASKAPRIEELEDEFMSTLKRIPNCSKTAFVLIKNRRLLITRSMNDFATASIRRSLYSSLSSQPIHQSIFKNTVLCIAPKCPPREPVSSTSPRQSFHSDESSWRSISEEQQAAIIEIEHQVYPSISLSTKFTKPLEKSHSSPLPIHTNHASFSNNQVESAHLIDRSTTQSTSSDEESVPHRLFQYPENPIEKTIRHRWSLFDIWETNKTKLPSILNCIWRQRLYRTGSKEFLLEYDQTMPTNNNNSNSRASPVREQRYVEQERRLDSHIGLALLAVVVFPPVGMIALVLSIWSICGQQDRHLSRKFGYAVYWISMFAICLSFLLLMTLFTYFTYQYLKGRSTSLTNNVDYI